MAGAPVLAWSGGWLAGWGAHVQAASEASLGQGGEVPVLGGHHGLRHGPGSAEVVHEALHAGALVGAYSHLRAGRRPFRIVEAGDSDGEGSHAAGHRGPGVALYARGHNGPGVDDLEGGPYAGGGLEAERLGAGHEPGKK